MGALDDLIKARFGTNTRPRDNPENASIGVTPLLILRQNPDRLAFSVVNLSTNAVFIGPFQDVSSTKGYRLVISGGSISFLGDEDFHVVGYDWFAVAAGAASQIFIQEQIHE